MAFRSPLFLSSPLCLVTLTMAACASSKPEPVIASSAAQANYAERYPAELQATMANVGKQKQDERAILAAFPHYPEELKDPPWPTVLTIMTRADEAGRTYAYVEQRQELERTKAFFTEERNDISQKIAGSTQYALKEKGCNVDVQGAVSGALKDAIDKRLEKRLRAHNEAHILIERYRISLGKDNAVALEKQADDISYASYIAYISLKEQEGRLKQLLEDTDHVRKTSDEFLVAEGQFQAEPGRTEAEKRASTERMNTMNQSKAQLDSAATQAKEASSPMEDDIKGLQKDYEIALSKLKQAISDKKSKR